MVGYTVCQRLLHVEKASPKLRGAVSHSDSLVCQMFVLNLLDWTAGFGPSQVVTVPLNLDVPYCNKTVVNSNCSETLCEGKRVLGETRRRRGFY